MMTEKQTLAINGGPKVRTQPLPPRRLMGEDELKAIGLVFQRSWETGVDFGYQGEFERRYTEAFSTYQGGGYSDGVCSGTAAVYVALASLELEAGAEVVVSPVTDPGSVSPVLLLGFGLAVADAAPGSFNVGEKEFEAALTPHTRAAIITHSGGRPAEISGISEIASKRGIRIIEDCSQAHGARIQGQRVGTFGDLAAFSTMFSKNHTTGGTGGVVFTREEGLYWKVRAYADRGKAFHDRAFNPKNASEFQFPALNLNMDELSAAIGISTLGKLDDILERRRATSARIDELLLQRSRVIHPVPLPQGVEPSPFFHTVEVDINAISVGKQEFAEAVSAEGIGINPHYDYLVADWPWVRKYLPEGTDTPQARAFRGRTFNILFHEQYTEREVDDIVNAIIKVENAYKR